MRPQTQNKPKQSISRCSLVLGLSPTALWQILRTNLGVHPYKIKLTQELKPFDQVQRRVLPSQMKHSTWLKKMKTFSDEAHFWFNGFIHEQTMHCWTNENPPVLYKTSLYPAKITFWSGFLADDIIGPCFFIVENDSHATSLFGICHRDILESYFF